MNALEHFEDLYGDLNLSPKGRQVLPRDYYLDYPARLDCSRA